MEEAQARARSRSGGNAFYGGAVAEGAKVYGTLAEIGTTDSKSGKVPVWTIELEDGTIDAIGYHSVLRREMEEQGAAIGDTIFIEYTGQGKTRAGQPVHLYAVDVDKNGTP